MTSREPAAEKMTVGLDHTISAHAKRMPVSSAECVSVVAEAEDSPDVCWVCLDQGSAERPLMHPCRCPSWCHAGCIARWQLQSAGTRREHFCDFCTSRLPNWKEVLTPSAGSYTPAVMNVNFDNKTYSFEVTPGMDGYALFTKAIRKAFRLPDDSELNITFTCDEPSSGAMGSLLTLQGAGAYDAAVHCASVSAARRLSSAGGSECASELDDESEHTHSAPGGGATGSGSSSEAGGSRRSSISSEGGSSSSSGASEAASSTSGGSRRSSSSGSGGGSFGRKLRSALNELLAIR